MRSFDLRFKDERGFHVMASGGGSISGQKS
jgi:hypothetical protein